MSLHPISAQSKIPLTIADSSGSELVIVYDSLSDGILLGFDYANALAVVFD